jgi:hypothetical protein
VTQEFKSTTDFFTLHYVRAVKAKPVVPIKDQAAKLAASMERYPVDSTADEEAGVDQRNEDRQVAQEVSEYNELQENEDVLETYVCFPDQSLREYPLKGTNMFQSAVTHSKDSDGKNVRTGAKVRLLRKGVCAVVLHGSGHKACAKLL